MSEIAEILKIHKHYIQKKKDFMEKYADDCLKRYEDLIDKGQSDKAAGIIEALEHFLKIQ